MQEEGVGTQRILSRVESPSRTMVGWGEAAAMVEQSGSAFGFRVLHAFASGVSVFKPAFAGNLRCCVNELNLLPLNQSIAPAARAASVTRRSPPMQVTCDM